MKRTTRLKELKEWLKKDEIKQLPIRKVIDLAEQEEYTAREVRAMVLENFIPDEYPRPDIPTEAELSELLEVRAEDIGRQ